MAPGNVVVIGAGASGVLTAAALLDRAGVLAVANDLAPAAAALEPGLVALRRALIRRLGRPVGQSGSGPTLWVLYPSRAEAEAAAEQVRAAVADGTIPIPGVGDPFIAATAIAGRAVSDRSDR